MEKEKKVKDVDFADSAVPSSARKNVVTMFMIMLGFTFFSASMWVGQQLADGLDFWGFLGSLILGGIILGIYTGLLGYVGAKTGLSLDLLSQRAFGEKGSYLPSAMTALRRSDGLVSVLPCLQFRFPRSCSAEALRHSGDLLFLPASA